MQYPRFYGIIPLGKEIDLAITQHRLDDAIAMLRDSERDLTLRRKRRGERFLKFPKGSKQRQIDETAMGILNKRLDLICNTLRGNNGLFWKVARAKGVMPRRQPRRIRI